MDAWMIIGWVVAAVVAVLYLTMGVTKALFIAENEKRALELETRKRELGVVQSAVEPQIVLVEPKTPEPVLEHRNFENYQPKAYSWRDDDSKN